MTLPPIKWRAKGILPETGLAAIFGPSGAGKSFFALSLAMALSVGGEWFGSYISACHVTYCALEGAVGMVNRAKAYREMYPTNNKQLHFLTEPINLRNRDDVEALAQAILAKGAGSGVVIIDTLNRASPGADENASRDMSDIIGNVSHLQALIGGLVILIHHTGKDENKGLRGHSSLLAALDVAIEVKRQGKSDKRTWQVTKSKDGSEGVPYHFTLEKVAIGIDEDGEKVMTCIVAPILDKEGKAIIKEKNLPSGKNQITILKALQELFSQTSIKGDTLPSFIPNNRRAIRREDAVSQTKDQLDCPQNRKVERAKKVINDLIKNNWLFEQDGWLWLP